MKYMIGVDIGTTHLKACLLDEKRNIIKLASVENCTTVQTDIGSCYDPNIFWEQIKRLLKKVAAAAKGEIAAIGLTGMADTGLPVDENGSPLFPIIPWSSNCGLEYQEQILKDFSQKQLYKITGLPYHPKYALSRLLYLFKNEAAKMKKMLHWLSIYDYTIFLLTGEYVTDETQACRTMLFNIHTHSWETSLTDYAKVTGKLPRVIPMGEIAGRLKPEVAKMLGLPAGIPLVCGGHDHLCAMLAADTAQGEVFNSQGTSEVFIGYVPVGGDDDICLKYGICQGCFIGGKRYWLANLPSSGASVEWLRRLTVDDAPLPYNIFEDAAALTDSGGVVYLPMINGSGTPHPNPKNSGLLLGLRSSTTIYHIAKAVYEGISFETRWILDSIEETFGLKINTLVAVGGSVKNPVLLQTRADVTGRTYHKTPICELTLYGAATLAAKAAFFPMDKNSGLPHMLAVSPNEKNFVCYTKRYNKYRALYEDIAPYLSKNTDC